MQTAMFNEEIIALDKKITVNVASVPQRSPFRYPGGKTWLVPRLRQWLQSQPSQPREFIEPFAGGGISSLTAAFEHLVQSVTMVELDEQVAAVWRVILDNSNGGEWLAKTIMEFEMTPENVKQILSLKEPDLREMAFQTILKNRINHGGILAPGVGTLKHGENGKGIKSRWYPQTLKKRILEIVSQKDSIRFIEGNGINVIKENITRSNVVFFIDPPYTAQGNGKRAGTRLYKYNELNHEELFRIVSQLEGDFLMTYDNAPSVLELAEKFNFQTQAIAMRNTHHAEMTELLIGRDLSWAS
jgi:DNA adenine methylase